MRPSVTPFKKKENASPNILMNAVIFTPDDTWRVYDNQGNIEHQGSDIQGKCKDIYSQQRRNQFGTERYALVFLPGIYYLNIKVGYYTSIIGLSKDPSEVVDKAKVDHCVVVNGDNITSYCLMIEHTLKELCVWNGDNGKIFFIQSELAYDVGDYKFNWDYPGLKVTGKNFYGTNLGVYSYFSNEHHATATTPHVTSAVTVPTDAKIDSAMSLILNNELGKDGGGGVIQYVINKKGQQTDRQHAGKPSWCCYKPKAYCKTCYTPL